VTEGEVVKVQLRDLNLDAHLLIERLQSVAQEGTLEGEFVVTAFGREVRPEDSLRVIFEAGRTLVQHPVLWPDTANA
jgi:hypothetical protein